MIAGSDLVKYQQRRPEEEKSYHVVSRSLIHVGVADNTLHHSRLGISSAIGIGDGDSVPGNGAKVVVLDRQEMSRNEKPWAKAVLRSINQQERR